jgi:hypothetical protein
MREIEPGEMNIVLGGLSLPPNPPPGLKLANGRPVTQANWNYWKMVLKNVSAEDFGKIQQRHQQRPIGWDPSVPGGGFLETPGGR